MEKVDITIIGAGVVGLAIARTLSESDKTVLLIEKNERFGVETSSRNSEVIHSGIYYPRESLKTRLCLKGNAELYELCAHKNIPCIRSGKIIIARNKDEEQPLEELYAQGKNNGVKELSMLTRKEVNRLEPLVSVYCGLLVPSTGVIDSELLMRYLFTASDEQGSISLFNSTVTQINYAGPHSFRVTITPNNEVFESRWVINSAGLHADIVASLVGIDIDKEEYRLRYSKGEYYSLKRDDEYAFSRLIYPLPESAVKSLGIHLCFNTKKKIRFGPNRYSVEKIDYTMDESHKNEFISSINTYLPSINKDDLYMDTCGIRPQRKTKNGSCEDFVINEESAKGFPGMINLIGIESPGLTAAPAIAEYVADIIK